MIQHEACKKYADCGWRKSIGYCPEECNHFKHKDEVIVVHCADCEIRGNEDECPLLSLADYTEDDDYCSFGRRSEDG